MSHPSSRFRNRRLSTQYSRAALRPHFVFIPHSRSGRSGILQSEGSLTLLLTSGRYPTGGEGGAGLTVILLHRAFTHARSRARIRCVRRRSRSRLTHAPALCLFTIPGSVSKEARTKMTSINGIPGRSAGWLADDGQTIGSVPDRRQRGISKTRK